MSDTPIIRLLDSSGKTLLDSVSAEYEDSFELETFANLIKEAEEAEPKGKRHFIIARVQTWDHRQPDRAFYSYYHAHHLNRLLFQTQVYLDKKLIHRLHVMNPLTNTDIIGNVLYFMVIGKTGRLKAADIRSATSISPVISKTKKMDDDLPPISPSVAETPKISDPVALNRAIHLKSEEKNSQLNLEVGINEGGWTWGGPMSATIDEGLDTKDEFGLGPEYSSPSRSYSTAFPYLKRKKRHASIQTGLGRIKPSQNNGFQRIEEADEDEMGSQTKLTIDTNINRNSSNYALTERMRSAPPKMLRAINWDGLTSSPMKRRLSIKLGEVTHHGSPLTQLEAKNLIPPSSKGRRRKLSYMNAIETSGSHGASVENWKKILLETDEKPGEYDEVRPFGSHSKLDRTQELESYDAVLICTDNDFLEKSKVRATFKENVIHPGDFTLFEMPPYYGEGNENEMIGFGLGNTDIPCDSCLATEADLNHPNLLIRWFHRTKCLLLLGLSLAIMGLFIWIVVGS